MRINKNLIGRLTGVHVSSIVDEGIKATLNLFIFFYEKILRTKKHKTRASEQKQKR